MELALLFVFGAIAVTIVLPILTFVKVNNIGNDIEELKRLVSNKHETKEKTARPEAAPRLAPAAGEATPTPPAAPKMQTDSPRPNVLHEEKAKERKVEEVESRAKGEAAKLIADEPPSALDIFWSKIEDWVCVRGSFAPKGMTREFAVATRWLARVGVILITGSVVYFAKLSIDRGWMGPTGRVSMMILAGAAAAAAGAWLVKRTRYGLIGHAVAALGFTALYLGFGLGHRFFDPPVIASAGLAFAALAGVTFAAGAMSVFLASPAIAVMALAGGYLVPIVAPCGGESPLGLCSYMMILNVGAFFVARARGWSALDFLAATLAYLISFIWCGRYPSAGQWALLEVFAFLSAVHALYMASVVAGAKARGRAGNAIAWAGLAANACAFLGWLAVHFRSGFSNEKAGLVLLALVAVYLAVAKCATKRGWADAQTVNLLFLFAVVFLAASPILLFGANWCCVSWSILAAAVASAEERTGQKLLVHLSLLILLAAALNGLFYLAPRAYTVEGAPYWRDLALRALRLWTLPAAAAWIARRSRSWLLLPSLAVAFLFYSLEAWHFAAALMPSFKHGAVTLAWTLAAFAGVWRGLATRTKNLRIAGLALLGVSAAKLLLIDTAHLATPARVAAFAIVGTLFIVGSFLYIKFKERFESHE